jgi:hypothetical protein
MANGDDNKPELFQQVIGGKITQMVLWGTILIAVVGIVFAGVALSVDDDAKVKTAFGMLQYIFGALLPLWGTWIGTVLAYYYSKQNFDSANRSIQKIVDKFTSEQKLESVKAKDVMIARARLITQKLSKAEGLSKFNLKEDCLDFIEKNKIKRIVILDEQDRAKYVVHRDLISYFITNEILQGRSVSGYTLEDMYAKGSQEIRDTMDNSVKFISEQANLLEAKQIMMKYKNCRDVFVTLNGIASEPILGWITDVTISENSIV